MSRPLAGGGPDGYLLPGCAGATATDRDYTVTPRTTPLFSARAAVAVLGAAVLLGMGSPAGVAPAADGAAPVARPAGPSGGGARSPAQPAVKPAVPRRFQVLHAREDLKAPFNADRGKVRIVAFLSPSCGHCAKNARALQLKVLEQIDSPDVSVHIVWIKLLDQDSKEIVPEAMRLLPDPRVHHYWDPERRLNAQLLDAIAFDVMVRMYDIFLLYDRDAAWDKRLPKPGFWMHEFEGAPGPTWNADVFAAQVRKALSGAPLDTPQPQ